MYNSELAVLLNFIAWNQLGLLDDVTRGSFTLHSTEEGLECIFIIKNMVLIQLVQSSRTVFQRKEEVPENKAVLVLNNIEEQKNQDDGSLSGKIWDSMSNKMMIVIVGIITHKIIKIS